MDYMDIDEIEEVPDTPERYKITYNNSTGKQSDGSSSCRVIDKDRFHENLRNEPREKGKSVTINGSRRLFERPDNYNISPSFVLGNSSSSTNVLHTVDNVHHDKGKILNTQRFTSQERNGFVEQNGRDHVFGLNNTIRLGPKSEHILDDTPPRVNRHKRLVRNGCISPHNIAKSKQEIVVDAGNMSSNTVNIKDLTAETKDSHRFKGKGVYPSFREEPNARNRHLSQRRSEIFKESTDANKESEGWITTQNDQHISRGKSASSNNIYNDFEDFQRDSGPPDTVYLRAHDLGQFKEPAQLTKRQGDNGVGTSGLVISVDELTNEDVNHGLSTNHCSYEDSGVRALQLEADEMLARELQEQLYNEELGSAFGINQMDSHAIYSGGRPATRPASRISSSSSNLYQQSRSNASRNPSLNRGPQAQTASSSRLARFRGHFTGRPRSLSSGNSIFPSNMNVDMRMEILEALEAFNDMELPFNDMELPNDLLAFNDMEFPNEMLQMGREFNENDYEMLLALDENNDRHEGATRAQINNLPQSTVQAENLLECAICLETPTVGETIRHLPCLHKFHKDCIDEWLKRKTSCPVCKSSVT